MKKIGITGSIASGKTTASKLLSKGRGPLFSADDYVKKLYKKKYFKRKIVRKLGLKNISNFKKKIREKISIDNSYIKKLEKIIHPLVRKEMRSFIKRNKNRKFVFFEIPLLIESKLMRNFDEIIFIKAKTKIRQRRFKKNVGDKNFFNALNNKQLSDAKKIKYCDHVVNNDKSKKMLKNKLSALFKRYE